MKRLIIFLYSVFFLPLSLGAQEALKSIEEEYYDFLSLDGLTDRPTLNYRTLSDSVWQLNPQAEGVHIWKNNNLGSIRPVIGEFSYKIYGPELFMSVNTLAPYGQNDGALWQGRGFNASLTGGVRLEAYGFELTFKPQLSFSQNVAFDITLPNSNYLGPLYEGKANIYGYYGIHYIDAPQRFGNKPFFTFDWGDTEIRYNWENLTIGLGTQSIWLGPAQINPIIHSNNAASYPKLDIGLRKQRIAIPQLGWYLGDIELRAWWGYLSESDYFDTDPSNDHNLITGLAIAYGVPFLPGLTVGFNRIMLSKWEEKNAGALFDLLIPSMGNGKFGFDNSDQRASVVLDYMLPQVGFNIYLEWGRNDYSPAIEYVVRYPFHTQGYTVGLKKSINMTDYLKGEILLELTNLESSRDYENLIGWATTFYAHHLITQGHTNRGQWLGAGIGTGGNSQYAGFKLYFPQGNGLIFLQRRNPDLDYTWFIDKSELNIRTMLDFGLSATYFPIPSLKLYAQFVLSSEFNPTYDQSVPTRYNCHIAAGLKYQF